MDGDFLSHDFIDEFPMDATEPDDSLVQHITHGYGGVLESDPSAHYFMQMPEGTNELSVTLQQQPEEMFNPINLVPLSNPVALTSAATTQIQTQIRPTYPVLERVQQIQNIPDTLPQQQPQQLPDEYDAEDVDDEEEDDVEHVAPAVPVAAVAKVLKPRKPKSPRKKKDPNAPSAPMSAYAFFFRETQMRVKEHNPAAKFGDISRSVAAMWEGMDETEKLIFRKKSEEDRARYNTEMETYKLSQPPADAKDQSTIKQATKSVKVVYLGGKMKTTTTTTSISAASATTTTAPAYVQVESHVFQSPNTPSIMPVSNERVVRPEDVTENECIRQGCQKFAIVSPEWEDEYCSNECAVKHCKDIFAKFVSGQSINGAAA